jgi:hypothetical protein
MFYLEYILIILIIASFMLHLKAEDLYSYFLYNTSLIIFGFLSLNSIFNLTNESTLVGILNFIMQDETGMSIFVELFLANFLLCVILMCYNFYVIYKEMLEIKSKK